MKQNHDGAMSGGIYCSQRMQNLFHEKYPVYSGLYFHTFNWVWTEYGDLIFKTQSQVRV